MKHRITRKDIARFEQDLFARERAGNTIERYPAQITQFADWAKGRPVDKERVVQYKQWLMERYSPASVNVTLAALNSFFRFKGWQECCVRPVKVQRKFITVQAVNKGRAEIRNKGKYRTILLPRLLCAKLRSYCIERGIAQGCVFVTRSGKPINRTNIWAMMKALCRQAQVAPKKVFPHNLRHLFARCFYQCQQDLEHLASLLGHSNINTTRIYTQTSGREHLRQIERLRLIL